MSQPTTSECGSSESFRELAQRSPKSAARAEKQARIDNWQHDRQPGWDDYPSDSDKSVVPCSLGVPLTPHSSPASKDPKAKILVPETPKSIRALQSQMGNAEAEAERQQVMEFLKEKGFTSFAHEMAGTKRTMLLAFKIYIPSQEEA
jgi:hypothetical protein